MAEVDLAASPQERPLSITSFQGKLDKFEKYIAHVTLQNTEASTEEKRQAINDNLRYENFCDHIRTLFGTELKSQDLKAIHRKLSTNPDVKIDWSEVFGYFQVENESTEADEVSVFTASQRKIIGEAAGDKKRRDTIQAVVYSLEFDYYLTASQKGAISIYNGKLRLQNCIDINESAWMTSVQYLPKLRKVIATTERSIVIWDHRAKGKNQLNVHVIKPLEHSPQCMCLIPMEDDHCDALLIGDDAGYINLVRLTHNDFVVKANKDQKRLMKYHVIDPSTLTIPIIRRKFHHDWVLQVQYLPDLKCFASCSPGERQSLVIGNLKRLHDTQPVSGLPIPRGVNAFCYSEKSNIFATGGVDKTIRLWHPNILSRPTGKMVGHLFTIVDIVMNDKDQHIISLSTARVFRVWDIHTLACLQVFTDSDERSGDRRISTMLFDGRHDRLITGSNTVDLWPMTRTVQDTMSVPHTHDHPLAMVVLNTVAWQIITVCTESIIKVWEVETGRQMYQIMDAHGPNVEVTSVAVDMTGTRMATGGSDGSLKIWEFSSGQEIKSLLPEEPNEDDQSVLALSYISDAQALDNQEDEENVTMEETAENPAMLLATQQESIVERKPQNILAMGWNNKLKLFLDEENSSEILKVCVFDGMYEWPLPPAPTSPTFSMIDAADENKLNNDEVEPRKENVLERNEMTVFALLHHRDVIPTLVTGCANGNLLLWDYNQANVTAVFDLAKAELASSYDSQHHRSKEKYPHRINGVVMLCHKVFKPDPEEVKRRMRLKRKKMLEEAGLDDDSEQDKSEKAESGEVDARVDDDDDPSKEVDLDIQESDGEEETQDEDEEERSRHGIDYSSIDKEAIKMIEVLFPPVIASCHQDTDIRLWSYEGELLSTVTPTTQVLSPLTAVCCDEFAHQLIAADAKGYITVWEVSEFLEKSTASMALQSRAELIKQLVCWRAHLMKITSLVYVNSSRVLVSASTDGSVRVWYPQRGHYVGYFGQHRMWHVEPNPSLPSSPVLPYDINEGPVNPVNVRSGRRKPQTKKYEYPLVFDADRWKPFRRSAYTREALQRNNQPQTSLNIIEIRNKKFFSALVKPKADKSGLESDKPVDSDTGAIFHHLPVYRLKTPPVQPKPTSYISEWGGEHSDTPKAGSSGGGKGTSKFPASSSQGQKTFRIARPVVRKSTNSTSGQIVAKKR